MKAASGYLDAHCHWTDDRLWNDLPQRVLECEAVGISQWVLAGYSPDDWERQTSLAVKYPGRMVPSFGLHPWWVCQQTTAAIDLALGALKDRLGAAAILGETGLDSFGPRGSFLEIQQHAFTRQMQLARDFEKPVALHIVRAHDAALAILKPYQPLRGWVHSFSGSPEQARVYLDMGLCISLGGSVLGKPPSKLRALLAAIPEDRLLLETDAPDQTPRLAEFAQETLNHPRNLVRIAQALEEFSGKDAGALLEISRKTIERVLA